MLKTIILTILFIMLLLNANMYECPSSISNSTSDRCDMIEIFIDNYNNNPNWNGCCDHSINGTFFHKRYK